MSVTNMSCGNSPQLREFIRKYRNEPFTIDDCFMKQVFRFGDKKTVLNESSLFSKYRNELATYLYKVNFTNEEYSRYRYNPKKLSYDLYGTTELWFLILYANQLYSISQFDMRSLYIYDGTVFNAISHIIDLESPFTDINESEVSVILKE